MSLPFDINTAYNNNNTPAINADDLNALQRDDVLHHRILTGEDFYLYDDFTGTNIDLTKWMDNGAYNKFSIANRAGASGCLKFLSTVDNESDALDSKQLCVGPSGLGDFRFVCRTEIADIPDQSAVSTIGLLDSDSAFFYILLNDFWTVYCKGTSHTTTVPIGGPGVFQTLDCRRVGGTTSFYIDGVLVYSEASVITLNDATFRLGFNRIGSNSEVYTDYAKLWFAR